MTERAPFESPNNFLALPEESSSWRDSRIAIIPAAYDGTTTFKSGTREGPEAMIDASQAIELYDQEFNREPALDVGIHTLPLIKPESCSPEEMVGMIEEDVEKVLSAGKFPVLFGGEHTVTLGAAKVLNEKIDGIGFVVLDAHADLRDEYEGTPYNHACVSRRLSEMGPVLQYGVRSLSIEEAEWLNSQSSNVVQAKDADSFSRELATLPDNVYLSVDLDVLDPSAMPSVGTPEPGGLMWQETLDLIDTVCANKNVLGFDVVELCPIPGIVAPDFLAARLVYKITAYMFSKKPLQLR